MLDYFDVATKTTFHQILSGFVVVFLIALLLNRIVSKLRHVLSSKLGSAYDYFVLPGCMCHELGRTLGCWLAGVGVEKFEIFNLNTDDAERVPIAVSVNKRFAFIRRFFILTGPIWVGSIVTCVIALIAAGTSIIPSYAQCFPEGCAGIVDYLTTVGLESVGMLFSLFTVWHWTSPFCLLGFYLLFCAGSQITISGRSLLLIWQSLIGVFFSLFLLNLVPGVNTAIAYLGDKVMPAVFLLHVTLGFVVVLNVAFYLLARLICGKPKGPEPRPSGGGHRQAGIYIRA